MTTGNPETYKDSNGARRLVADIGDAVVAASKRVFDPRDPPTVARLRDGTRVVGKLYKGEPSPCTYANRTQARRAAEKYGGEVIGFHPLYVRLPERRP